VINQVRLVVDALQRRQLPVAAVVLNRISPGDVDPSCATNRDEVSRWVDVPVVGPLPYTANASPDARADALLACAGIEALLPA